MQLMTVVFLFAVAIGAVLGHGTININCFEDDDCDQTAGLYCRFDVRLGVQYKCNIGRCACNSVDYIWTGTRCHLRWRTEGQFCGVNADCAQFAGLECDTGTAQATYTCKCPAGTTWSSSMCTGTRTSTTQIYKSLGTACVGGDRCVASSASSRVIGVVDPTFTCRASVCECDAGRLWERSGTVCTYRLKSLVGESCIGDTTNIASVAETGGICDNTTSAMTCTSSTCQCVAGYTDVMTISAISYCKFPGPVTEGNGCWDDRHDCAAGLFCYKCGTSNEQKCIAGGRALFGSLGLVAGMVVLTIGSIL